MSALVLFYCEDCKTHIEVVADYLGRDEDGLSEYEILHGAGPEDDRHIDARHDLSLPSG